MLKKYLIGLCIMGMMVSGCGTINRVKRLTIISSNGVRANSLLRAVGDLVELDKYFRTADENMPNVEGQTLLTAGYKEDGVFYRSNDPVTWSHDNESLGDITTNDELRECTFHPSGILGHTVLTAKSNTDSNNLDQATVYVVPCFYMNSRMNFGVVFNEIEWQSIGYKQGAWRDIPDESDMFIWSNLGDSCYLAFKYGVLDLKEQDPFKSSYNINLFGFVDFNATIDPNNKKIAIPSDGNFFQWALAYDSTGRKIAILIRGELGGNPRIIWYAQNQ